MYLQHWLLKRLKINLKESLNECRRDIDFVDNHEHRIGRVVGYQRNREVIFDDLVINLCFLWMGVGMAILLIHYRSIKKSQGKK